MPLVGGDGDQDLVTANNQFAFDLYAQLSKDRGNDNIFFSPLSLSAILAQTYAGARGNTAKEMTETLHLDPEADRLHPAMAALLASLEPPQGKAPYELNIANALWLEQTYTLLPEFVSLCQNHYRTAPRSVDFKHAAEAQRKTINDWVAEQTHGKIQDLMPSGSVNPDSRLVLTDAVYFRGAWLSPFSERLTESKEFKTPGEKSVQAPMMRQTSFFGYMQRRDLQVLEMPYVGRSLSMVVLLPRKIDGLPELEEKLSAKTISAWTRKLSKQEVKVEVEFPRFTVATFYSLAATLRAMGIRDAFSRKDADFSGATSSGPLFIGAVMHEAFVEVNEKGTEAAAATGLAKYAGKGGEPPPPPPVFRADHPFIFLIRDMRSGSILFLGRVLNPKTGPD
ncbi:MAG TPA: serpin family protein [Phycisphaerae bacterium]|nr:serpin family protein [Phycisphaerae bacterium]